MKYRLIYMFMAVAIASLVVAGCKKDYFPPVTIDPNTPVSYTNDIFPVFVQSCLGSGCHGTGQKTPYLDVRDDSYFSLTEGGFVDTLKPEQSILYTKMTKPVSGAIMPTSGKLPDAITQKILLWIKQGAKDN